MRRLKSGAFISWLEATPTIYLSPASPFLTSTRYVGAASCRDIIAFEPAHNAAIGHKMKFYNRFFIFL